MTGRSVPFRLAVVPGRLHVTGRPDLRQGRRLADRLRAAGRALELEPYVRFRGEVGEQGTFFVRDPAGNALEFKAFADDSQVFAR